MLDASLPILKGYQEATACFLCLLAILKHWMKQRHIFKNNKTSEMLFLWLSIKECIWTIIQIIWRMNVGYVVTVEVTFIQFLPSNDPDLIFLHLEITV